MRYVSQLRRKHTSLYAVLKLSIFQTMNACNGVVERPADDSWLIAGNVWSSIKFNVTCEKRLTVWLEFWTLTGWLPQAKNSRPHSSCRSDVMSIPGTHCRAVRQTCTPAWPTVQSPTDLSNLRINPLSKNLLQNWQKPFTVEMYRNINLSCLLWRSQLGRSIAK